ncbi:MAG: bifunctional metallophosphatase/5'-nucleotidase [Bacteroidales bacterium]|nr:bifunctional metallophosphatase/5'-nucleotidase [Bacteroidales bacterium]MCM1414660.1 bifunctional metallophosphatase/5'-nucleotidase [bacterium]MCM1424674.1 bifunctional metallophosphatase/5'-nucleotidase [bacterium]
MGKRKTAPLRRVCAAALSVIMLSAVFGCAQKEENRNIYILYTNDVHCAVDGNMGYARLAAYRSFLEEDSPYVTLVDCGDAIQGDAIGTVSDGAYPVELMNRTGYDYAVLGNHEFDYGMDQLAELIAVSDAAYLGCNITYSGDGENKLSAVKPYAMQQYGDVEVAFIGVSTPETVLSSTPSVFKDENGEYVYGFGAETEEAFYATVQESIDECREKGADYVVLLTHLGTDEVSEPFRSTDLIMETTGANAVLDGHSHSTIPCEYVENREGEPVLLSSTGEKMSAVGQLMITPKGQMVSTLITGYPHEDEEMAACVAQIQQRYEDTLNEKIGSSSVELTTVGSDGVRLVRSRETNLGDFCADAYREVSGADIAFVNGGGIRADIAAGSVTYGDIIAVHPYGNTLCMVQASGQEILDCLEMSCSQMMTEVSDAGNAVGENGGFQQVSGIRFQVDLSVEPSVVTDENGMFVSVEGERRVQDAEVLREDGSYLPLKPDQMYTVASHNYLIKEGGDGLCMFADDQLLIDEGMSDYQVLSTYIREHLGGTIGDEYGKEQGRIKVLSEE